jgi:uncharacterized oxidoreductase
MNIKSAQITEIVTRVFVARGVAKEIADVVAVSLVLSNLKGHDSHGIIRVVEYLDWIERGWIDPKGSFEVLHETPSLLHVAGGFNFWA